MDMKKNITIKDGTSKSQLMKAIKNYETELHTTVLIVFVATTHILLLTEFDGIDVGKWKCNVDDFINGVYVSKMELINTLC